MYDPPHLLGNAHLQSIRASTAPHQQLARPVALSIEVTEHGGHCAFIMDWRL